MWLKYVIKFWDNITGITVKIEHILDVNPRKILKIK